MYVNWYFAEHFSDLSYRFFWKSKSRILDELRVSFELWNLHLSDRRIDIPQNLLDFFKKPIDSKQNILHEFLKLLKILKISLSTSEN